MINKWRIYCMKQNEKIYSLKNAAPVSASTNLNPHAIFFRKSSYVTSNGIESDATWGIFPQIDEKMRHQKYHMKGVQMHNICKQ